MATAVPRALPRVSEIMALGGSPTRKTHGIPRGPLSCGRGRLKRTLWAGRVALLDTEGRKIHSRCLLSFQTPAPKATRSSMGRRTAEGWRSRGKTSDRGQSSDTSSSEGDGDIAARSVLNLCYNKCRNVIKAPVQPLARGGESVTDIGFVPSCDTCV